MTLLAETRTRAMLEASLEALHQESSEWLDTLDFWKDESAFLLSLIEKRYAADADNILKNTGNMLVEATEIHFEELNAAVKDHERMLATLLKHESSNEQEYRHAHKNIAEKMRVFETEMRVIKKKLFSSVKTMHTPQS